MGNSQFSDYHDLLPRHHAMQLRKRILSPVRSPSDCGGARERADTYDGRADQQIIKRYLDLTPLHTVMEHMYEAMFSRRPYLRSMFPHSMDFQHDRLVQSFVFLIDNLHRTDVIKETFSRLGRDHRKLGVWPAHYETFKTALRDALRISGGPHWSAELEDAWMRMLQYAVDSMICGAEAAIAEPPYWRGEVIGHERRRPDLAVLRVRTNEPYMYRPGQFGTVQSLHLPHAWRRYWVACAPRNDNVLEFHVQLSGLGGVSEALVQRTDVGDTLRLGPANGTMTLDNVAPDQDLLLIAGGTGVAPMKAILEDLEGRHQGNRRVHLFVVAQTRAELYDWKALAELDSRCQWLRLIPVISDEPQFSGMSGTVVDALRRYSDWSRHLAFVAGSPEMVNATVAHLIEMNIPSERIRYDSVPRSNTQRMAAMG